jgi:uncharacterized protein YodC (DUF2158 family)
MAAFTPGDVVVLKSGSMRMLVEGVEGERVSVVWANDGGIGRETLPAFALNKWEDRGPREERPARPARPRYTPRDEGDEGAGGGDERPARPYGGAKKGGSKPYAAKPAGDRPYKPKTGMDGKPKSKTFFRKDE